MTRPEHLAALTADMAPPVARTIIRTALAAFTGDEYAEWHRSVDAARQARRRSEKCHAGENMPSVTSGSKCHAANSVESVTSGSKCHDSDLFATVTDTPCHAANSVESVTLPPLSSASASASASSSSSSGARGEWTPPTAKQVVEYLGRVAAPDSSIDPDQRAEAAAKYLDSRVAAGWVLGGKEGGAVIRSAQQAEADMRIFARNWARNAKKTAALNPPSNVIPGPGAAPVRPPRKTYVIPGYTPTPAAAPVA